MDRPGDAGGGVARAHRIARVAAASAVAIGLAAGCGRDQSILNPRGTDAQGAADLWWLMFWIGLVVWVLVTAATIYALWRRRGGPHDPLAAHRRENMPIVWLGIVIPSVVLVVVTGLTIATMRDLDRRERPDDLVVQVIGHQWWWEVRYPAEDVVTANEVHIPAGRPVRVELATADVIHSFWVPALAGKIDLVPGRSNTLWIDGHRPGVYLGQCAEFCGLQHAKMRFRVVVQPEDEYRDWVAGQRAPAAVPADDAGLAARGRQVFLSSSCVYCHTVRGTAALADVGPDLTHLASRDTLAAGIMPNTKGHLGGWIVDPQNVKPGAKMPGTDLPPDQLQALLAYLGSLD